jgi:beta-N-acetylhexosaminidase
MTPFILGLEGLTLTADERQCFKHLAPAGFILFARNIESEDQVKRLTFDLKELTGRPSLPILIDCEGGRVFRLPESMYPTPPSAQTLGELYDVNPEAGLVTCYDVYHNLALYLKDLGISVNCAPVLDLHVDGASSVMGDRTFSSDPRVVGALGGAAVRAMQDAGVIPVIKHMPGHGAALYDSHLVRPHVNLPMIALEQHMLPFKDVIAVQPDAPKVPLWAMTAHIVYTAIDPATPGTLSASLIQNVMRGHIGFEGPLISDDMVMGAVSDIPLNERVRRALEAGCDLLIFGHGGCGLYEQASLALDVLSPQARDRLSHFVGRNFIL